jgi:hypothetical protein
MIMKRVIQLDDDGCAVACAAIVAGVSYEKARRTSRRIFPSLRTNHLDADQMRRLLAEFGVRARCAPYVSLSQRIPAILLLKWEYMRVYHNIVWDPRNERFIDPDPDPLNSDAGYYVRRWRASGGASLQIIG